NSPTWQGVSDCRAGTCLSFDGINDYINLGTEALGPELNNASGVTLSYWLNLSQTPTAGNAYQTVAIIIGASAGGVDSKIDENRRITFGGRSQSSDTFQNAISNTTLSIGTWYHVLGVYDYSADLINVYINGVLDSSWPVNFGASKYIHSWVSGSDFLGNFQSQNRFLNGRLDEVHIYNRALVPEEILNPYNDLK
ncbi:MAG: LamG domain-containing protein, partial [Patescibacteria group bacterium]